jgi:hypothetical protein
MQQHDMSRGLGDDIKKISSAIGLDKLAQHIALVLNEDCGCEKRQSWLNDKTKNWTYYKTKTENNKWH